MQPESEKIDFNDPELNAQLEAEREALAKQLDEHMTLREELPKRWAREEEQRAAAEAARPMGQKMQGWLDDWSESLRAWYIVLSVDTQSAIAQCFSALGLHLASRLDRLRDECVPLERHT